MIEKVAGINLPSARRLAQGIMDWKYILKCIRLLLSFNLTMAPATKRARKAKPSGNLSSKGPKYKSPSLSEESVIREGDEASGGENDDLGSDDDMIAGSESSTDTETEIYRAQNTKSKKTSSKYSLVYDNIL